MARRFVALLTALWMAHLTLVGAGDFACANHPGDAAGMHHPSTHHMHGPSNGARAANDAAPCRTPSVPMCCQALQSCTLALAVVEPRPVHPVSRARDLASATESRIPLSEFIAPDPPPPRA